MKPVKKTAFSIFLTAVLLGNATLPAVALSLKSNVTFGKLVTYGLNSSAYIIEKKNAREAATKLATYDVIWDTLGYGEEVLLNGDPEAFPKLKDKIVLVKTAIESMQKIAEQVATGDYDEAVITAAGVWVTKVNNPVVSIMYEMIKLAHESNKAVNETKAALEIEALYNVINHDRRLIGKSTGDSPKLIPVNPETCDYFYNKYMITDDTVRGYVKTYVKNKLGEDFPEISYGSSLWGMLTGYTDEITKEHELKELEQFRNQSRRWIKLMLDDLNYQVTEEWAKTRLRQETARFNEFARNFNTAYTSVDTILAYYKAKRAFEKRDGAKEYREALPKLNEQAQKAIAVYGKVDLNKPFDEYTSDELGKINEAYRLLYSVHSSAERYAHNSSIYDLDGLVGSFEAVRVRVVPMIGELLDFFSRKEEFDFAENQEMVPYIFEIKAPDDTVTQAINTMLRDFQGVAGSFSELPEIEEDKNLGSLRIINSEIKRYEQWLFNLPKEVFGGVNPYERAKEIQEEKEKLEELKQQFYEEKHANSPLLREDEIEKQWIGMHPEKQEEEAEKVVSNLAAQRERIREEIKNLEKTLEAMNKQIQSMAENTDITEENPALTRQINERNKLANRIRRAKSAFEDANGIISNLQKHIDEEARKAAGYISSLEQIKEDAAVEAARALREVEFRWEKFGDQTDGNLEYARLLKNCEDRLEPYTSMGPFAQNFTDIKQGFDYAVTKKMWQISPMAESIMRGVNFGDISQSQGALYEIENFKKDWKTVRLPQEEVMNELLKMDNKDIRTFQEQYNKLNVFFTSFNLNYYLDKTEEIRARALAEDRNREPDYQYLVDMKNQWKKWYIYAEKNGVMLVAIPGEKPYFSFGKLRPYKYDGKMYAEIYSDGYSHLASSQELAQISMNTDAYRVMSMLKRQKVYAFISSNFPQMKNLLDEMEHPERRFATTKTPNFFIGQKLIWEKDIEMAEKLLKTAKAAKQQSKYRASMEELAELMLFDIKFPEKDPEIKDEAYYINVQNKIGIISDIYEDQYKSFDLGKQYLEIYYGVRDLIKAKGMELEKARAAKNQVDEGNQKIAEWSKQVADYAKQVPQEKDEDNLRKMHEAFTLLVSDYYRYEVPYYKSATLEASFTSVENLFEEYLNKFNKPVTNLAEVTEEIKQFYREFKEAYQSQEEYALMECISEDWQAVDGTTSIDLEDNFRNMFTIFDAITYQITGFSVQAQADNEYRVSYNVTITGEKYGRRKMHKESSRVSEIVSRNENGKFVITRTLQGKFWQ